MRSCFRYFKDTKKRARNMKFNSIFFTASALYLRGYRKDTKLKANHNADRQSAKLCRAVSDISKVQQYYTLAITKALTCAELCKFGISTLLKSSLSIVTATPYRSSSTIVIPAPPNCTCSSWKFFTNGMVLRYWRMRVRNIPLPVPCSMRS